MMPVKIGMNSHTRLTKKPSGSARAARQQQRADVGQQQHGDVVDEPDRDQQADQRQHLRAGVEALQQARACARRPPRTAPPAGPRRRRRSSSRRSSLAPLADAAARAEPGLGLQQPVRASRRARASCRACVAAVVSSPRQAGDEADEQRSTSAIASADGDRADDGRHDVAEARVRSAGEAVAVEQRVAPPAGVAVEALRHGAEAVLRRGRDRPARPRRTRRRARAGRAATAAPSRRGRRTPSATRPGGARARRRWSRRRGG